MPTASYRLDQAVRLLRGAAESLLQAADATLRPRAGRERLVSGAGGAGAAATAELVQPPRVVLDAVFFQLENTGIARLWRAILAEWSESGFASHVVVIDRDGTAPRLPGFTYRRLRAMRHHDSYLQRVALEAVCRAEQADLMISTYYTVGFSTLSIVYAYDMIPEVMGFDLKARMWRDKRRAIEHASAFLAISESTARDLARFYPSAAERPTRVVHCAADPLFSPATRREVEELLGELELPEPYVLFVGARDAAQKNATLAFDALGSIESQERPALLCVGGASDLEPQLAEKAIGGVVRVARLPDEQLRAAYSGALALLYPSHYEGFGLPMLEAMACGCPVVTCRNSALPEVAGEAALYVDEHDPAALAGAIATLRDDADVRARCRSLGLERARHFDWRASADAAEQFIREVVANPPAR